MLVILALLLDFGTTTISSSSQLIFDLFIPLDSYLRDTTLTGTAVTICGLTTGAMFMVYDSNVGVGSTRVTSVNSGLDTIGIDFHMLTMFMKSQIVKVNI